MAAFRDSKFCLLLAASLLLAAPALAATVPAKKAAAKPAPAPVEVQLDANSLMDQARQAQSRGENELAVRLAQSAIVAGPSRTDTYVTLGDVYAAGNEPDFARSYYNEALSIDPGDSAALKAIASLDHGLADQRAANTQGLQTGNP